MTRPLTQPFMGLRPVPEAAAGVVAPPYDVLNTEEARIRAKGKPHSFLHISKPEINFPEDATPRAPEVYASAASNLERMVTAGVLKRDPKPCYYVYRMVMDDHVQTGVVLGASVDAYDTGRIRRHELTRPEKEDDRVRQIDAVNAQTGPVLMAHPPSRGVEAVVARVTANPPACDVTADDGITHTLWVISDEADIIDITAAFEAMEALYIADGHHRSASASRVAAQRRKENPGAGPNAPWEFFLSVSFPKDEMLIFDYNRVLTHLNGMTAESFVGQLDKDFLVQPENAPVRPKFRRQFGMYLEGRWRRMTLRTEPEGIKSPAELLDVALLSGMVLSPMLGIEDVRRDRRIDFVGGIRGLEALSRRVDSGEMAVAFSLYPTSMDELMAVAAAGEVMPPKSTWFEPKLADGMVSLILD